MIDKEGLMKKSEEIVQLIESKGVDLTRPIILSCGWGITVCVVEAALEQIKIDNKTKSIRIFDGSWEEYSDRIKKDPFKEDFLWQMYRK